MLASENPFWEGNKSFTKEQHENNKRLLIKNLIIRALGIKDFHKICFRHGDANINNFIEEMAGNGGRYEGFAKEIERTMLVGMHPFRRTRLSTEINLWRQWHNTLTAAS
ncbi:MAG: hypothetical protein WC715_00005 [Patescibacteria group bacterium]|jgi:hypothetical protein